MRIFDRDNHDDVRFDCRGQGLSFGVIVARRHGAAVFDCRRSGWPAGALLFSFKGGAAPVAVDVHFEDRGVVDETIDGGERHRGIPEHRKMPLSLIG
jgi:hypothetical protein